MWETILVSIHRGTRSSFCLSSSNVGQQDITRKEKKLSKVRLQVKRPNLIHHLRKTGIELTVGPLYPPVLHVWIQQTTFKFNPMDTESPTAPAILYKNLEHPHNLVSAGESWNQHLVEKERWWYTLNFVHLETEGLGLQPPI